MALSITERLLTPGAEHGRTGQALTSVGITVHYVGNPGSTAEANRSWFENGAGGAHSSAHYIIGLNGEILRIIPENERAQHAGKSYAAKYDEMAKTNNSRYIGIECCHPDGSGLFNEKTYASLIALCADICKRRGFNPSTAVVRHYDITGKDCPLYYKNNSAAWNKLLTDISVSVTGGEKPCTVKVSLDGTFCHVTAENINGSWYISFAEMGGIKVRLADILLSAGYGVSWDAENATVVAIKK